jgi:acyl carrier protein
MHKTEVIDYLTEVIAELLLIDKTDILPHSSITEDLGIDSLDMQELYLSISSKFNINYNLIKIVNDTAVILSYENGLSDEEKLSRIESTMHITLSEDDKKDFLSRLGNETSGALIKRLQGYISVDMLADSILSLSSGM